jgi:hypothetical protein
MQAWPGFTCIVVVLMVPAFVGGDELAQVKFKDVVEAKFAHWDKDGDGKLSPREIDAFVANPRVSGDEAAAIAAIHAYFRDHPKSDALDKDVLTAPPAKQKIARDIDGTFKAFRNRIRKAPREIFVGDTLPSLKDFHQGHLGDCYFLCVVGAYVERDAAGFKKMFHPRQDGSCEVVFPKGKSLVIHKLTDVQIALGSTVGEQGLWINVAEVAFGREKFVHTPKDKRKPDELPIDIIAHGGGLDESIRLLTGNPSTWLDFNAKDSADAQHKKLRDALKAGLAKKHLMATCTPEKKKIPPAINGGHCYAVLGYKPKGDLVVVWNPFGNDHQPEQPPGLKNGYETKMGRFEVPVAEFVQIFGGLSSETPLPVKKK